MFLWANWEDSTCSEGASHSLTGSTDPQGFTSAALCFSSAGSRFQRRPHTGKDKQRDCPKVT